MQIEPNQINSLVPLNVPNNKHNHGGTLYLSGNRLYKIFKSTSYFETEVERNIDFQINHQIPNTPRVFEKIFINGIFSGYVMEYISNSNTIRSLIGQQISIELKLKAIHDIYTCLKYLHAHHIFLGDIHSENFLITKDGEGFIIDFDYMRFLGDEYKFTQCYLIKPNNSSHKIHVASFYTDNVKVMLVCLSLLLDISLEDFISPKEHSINLEEIYNNIIIKLNNDALNEYFLKIMFQQTPEYFIDFIDNNDIFTINKDMPIIKN